MAARRLAPTSPHRSSTHAISTAFGSTHPGSISLTSATSAVASTPRSLSSAATTSAFLAPTSSTVHWETMLSSLYCLGSATTTRRMPRKARLRPSGLLPAPAPMSMKQVSAMRGQARPGMGGKQLSTFVKIRDMGLLSTRDVKQLVGRFRGQQRLEARRAIAQAARTGERAIEHVGAGRGVRVFQVDIAAADALQHGRGL